MASEATQQKGTHAQKREKSLAEQITTLELVKVWIICKLSKHKCFVICFSFSIICYISQAQNSKENEKGWI